MDDNFNDCIYFDGCCCINESRKGESCITPKECGIFEECEYPESIPENNNNFHIQKI